MPSEAWVKEETIGEDIRRMCDEKGELFLRSVSLFSRKRRGEHLPGLEERPEGVEATVESGIAQQ